MGDTNISWTARPRRWTGLLLPINEPCRRGLPAGERCLDVECKRCWVKGFTVNPWDGCVEKTEACAHCYAKITAENRLGLDVWGKNKPREIRVNRAVKELLALDRRAAKLGQRVGVFSLSMGDIFEEHPDLGGPRNLYLTEAEKATHVDLMLLTKRPENITRMVPWPLEKWPKHIWIGATLASPGEEVFADALAVCKGFGATTFASVEPMLGKGPTPGPWLRSIDLVIPGGESGGGSRPFDVEAAERLVEACDIYGSRVWFKQMGSVWAQKNGGHLVKGASHGQDPYRWPKWAQRRELPETTNAT